MSVASKSLITGQPVFDASIVTSRDSTGKTEGEVEPWEESFTCNTSMLGCSEDKALSPISNGLHSDGSEEGMEASLHSDVPNLCLQPGKDY